MKRSISILLTLFILVGCQEVFPGKYEMHCNHNNANYSKEDEEHDFHIELPLKWTDKSTTYAVDDYIIKKESHYEIDLNKDAMNYFKNELNSDEDKLLDKVLNVLYFEFEEIEEFTTIQNEIKGNKFLLDVTIYSPKRKEGWRGIIPPDKYSLSRAYKTITDLKHTNIQCEIVKG